MQVRGECRTSCMKRLGHVTITSANLHMHDAGSKVVVRLIRDGKELRPIAVVGQCRFTPAHARTLAEFHIHTASHILTYPCTNTTNTRCQPAALLVCLSTHTYDNTLGKSTRSKPNLPYTHALDSKQLHSMMCRPVWRISG